MTEARTYMDGYSDGKEWAQADILYTVEPMTAVGVDAALARLAITEKANSMLLARNKWLEHTLEVAGASPVEPSLARVVELVAENERLRVALRFYANGEHYYLDEEEEFDTVSGEPANWLHSGVEDSATSIEDGAVARLTLRGESYHLD